MKGNMDIQSLVSVAVSRAGITTPLWVGFFTEIPTKEMLLEAIQRSENVGEVDFAVSLVKHWDGIYNISGSQVHPIQFADIKLGAITIVLLVGRLHTVKDTSPPHILLEEQGATIEAGWTPYRPGDDVGRGATAAEAIGDLVVRNKFVKVKDTMLMDSRWSVCKSNFVR